MREQETVIYNTGDEPILVEQADGSQMIVRLGEKRQARLLSRGDFASLGPVSVLLNHLPTMRDIVECFIEYRILISDILNIALVDDGVNASNSNFACIPDRDSAASALAKTAINRFNGFVRYAPEGRAGC